LLLQNTPWRLLQPMKHTAFVSPAELKLEGDIFSRGAAVFQWFVRKSLAHKVSEALH